MPWENIPLNDPIVSKRIRTTLPSNSFVLLLRSAAPHHVVANLLPIVGDEIEVRGDEFEILTVRYQATETAPGAV